jgi:uncharacterized protein YbbC (DUF1343 family)
MNISKLIIRNKIVFIFMIGLSLNFCAAPVKKTIDISEIYSESDTIKTIILGNENLISNYLELVSGKNCGLLTNSAAVNSNLESSIEVFFNHPKIKLIKLFSPEHGIRGAAYAGSLVNDNIDTQTGLKVYSLYGKDLKPSKEMLDDLEIVLIDLQDTGIRSYTYIYSMAEVMKAAAQYGKKVVVLDRPNPLGGINVEGNILEDGFESFLGMYPIPYRYGMTIGELARLFNNEFKIGCQLAIIPMKNWRRDMLWQDTGLQWVLTSPHMPNELSPLYSCITGPLGELQTVSNGVGYTIPFELIGAPWINAYEFANTLNDLNLPGVYFRPMFYKPFYATFGGQNCQGVQIHLTDPEACNLFITGLHILQTLIKLYPEQNIFANEDRLEMFNNVMGCDWILQDLRNNIPVEQIQKKWQNDLQDFLAIRERYLLY